MTYRKFSRLMGALLASASAILGSGVAISATPDRPLVIAHRGGAALMPENTFPAFDNAVQMGADLLEFDMQVTADNQLIIQHDGTVPSFCTAEPGASVEHAPIRTLFMQDVVKFDCGSHHRAIYPGQKAVPETPMPTLDAFLRRYKDSKALFFGETKMPRADEGSIDPVLFSRLVASKVHEYGMEDRFILQSGDWRTLDAMHEINSRIRTCLINVKPGAGDYLQLAHQHHASCILLKESQTTPEQVKELKEAGVMVFSDVVDNEVAWQANMALGVSAIFTNDPKGLIAFLKRQAVKRH